MEKKSNICLGCNQDQENHAPGCDLDHSAAAQLARSWKHNPNQSVWRNYPKRDDLGNPVIEWLPRENAVELNGSAFANIPQPANSGSLPFDGE